MYFKIADTRLSAFDERDTESTRNSDFVTKLSLEASQESITFRYGRTPESLAPLYLPMSS